MRRAPGSRTTRRSVQDDLARINALGYFADIAPPLVRARPNGIAITYRVVENPVITKIVFTGNQKVPSDTLLALMDLSVGQVFNTNTFRQDVLKINNYYERIGYGGQVPTHVKDINLDSKSGVLTLTIQEGLVVKTDRDRRRSAASAAADPAVTYLETRQRILRCGARCRL